MGIVLRYYPVSLIKRDKKRREELVLKASMAHSCEKRSEKRSQFGGTRLRLDELHARGHTSTRVRLL